MRAREGFTLVELLVVTVIGTIILASVYQTIVVQQQSVRQSYAIIGTQQNVRTAIQVLTSDLREVSGTDGDVTAADSISIAYRALRKAGVVCESDTTGGNWLSVAYVGEAFAAPDSLLIYADGPTRSANDDIWIRSSVSSVAPTTDCAGNPISTNVLRINLAPAASSIVRPGGLIRSFVPVRYRLTDSGTEGHLVRVEGPDSVAIVEDLTPMAGQGLRFRFWDTAQVAIPVANLASQATRNTIGRIQVKVRGSAIGGATGVNREFSDSLVSTIYLRGNRKLR